VVVGTPAAGQGSKAAGVRGLFRIDELGASANVTLVVDSHILGCTPDRPSD
jgi:hypothetical protein